MNQFFKLQLTIFIPIAAFLVVGGIYSLNGEIDREIGKIKAQEAAEVLLAAKSIEQNLQFVSNEVLILSESSLLKEYLHDPRPQTLSHLEKAFLSIARKRQFYHQIRWLDVNGKERIRIDTNHYVSNVIPDQKLQDKSNRYYFTDSVDLDMGKVYFSRFDLNIENGEIETPYRPMLRVATPVFDSNHEKNGIIIINYSGKKILADYLNQFLGSDPKHAMLVDGFGFWLSSTNKDDEWAFMFDKETRFSNQYPEIWSQLQDNENVQELSDTGLFTGRKIRINNEIDDSAEKNLLYVISFVSQADIDNELFNARSKIWGAVVILLLLSYFGIRVLARSLFEAEKHRRTIAVNQVKGLLLNSMTEGVIGIDQDGLCSFINAPALEQLGFDEQELLGENIHHMIHYKHKNGKDYPEEACPTTSTLTTGKVQHGQEFFIKKDGSFLPVELITNPIYENKEIAGAVLTFRDISEKIAAQQKIHQLSNYDRITNLPNRKLFTEKLAEVLDSHLKNDASSAFLVIDIDRFSSINESIGIEAGNMLLTAFADRVKSLLRNKDHLGRIGADEFAVLINDSSAENAIVWINRLYSIIEEPFNIIDKEFRLSVSVGICLLPEDANNTNDAFINTEIALSRSKNDSIEKMHFFSKDMQEHSANIAKIEHDLLSAVANDELFLEYQPQIARHNLKTIGVEALVRWQHPVEGLISPGEFIPVAEKTGIIGKIDQWVLINAVDQLSKWKNELPDQPFSVAVNLSPESFLSPGLPELLQGLITEKQVPAERIELEITERSMVKSPELAAERMSKLKKIGVKLSIDDFGTGYSSLGYLKKLPIDILKIDQSFIRDLLTDKNNASIVMAIISMSKALDLKTIAEGIEEEKELEFLNKINCDMYQGFYFSKPLSVENFKSWISA